MEPIPGDSRHVPALVHFPLGTKARITVYNIDTGLMAFLWSREPWVSLSSPRPPGELLMHVRSEHDLARVENQPVREQTSEQWKGLSAAPVVALPGQGRVAQIKATI